MTVRNIKQDSRSPEAFAMLFDHNPQPMWIYEQDSLAFLAVNDCAMKHYGYSQAEFLAMTLKDIRPAEDVSILLQESIEQRSGFKPMRRYRHLKKNGDVINVELSAHDIEFAGQAARLVLIRDITSRLKLEDRLQSDQSFIDTAHDIILRLQKMEVGVVLDDFGTGYSSLSHLYRFPFDGIKVDQSFVRQLGNSRNVEHVMDLIRLLGEKMCISIVPEGIETEDQLNRLRELGFMHAQGFLFGRPQTPENTMGPIPPERKDCI